MLVNPDIPRILIADDDEGIRFMINEIMAKEGYALDEASDGREAVDLAVANNYDLIILDVRMPRMDGIEALKEIRRQNVDSVVVMITAHGTQQTGMEAAAAGAYDYFSKPFELNEFRIVVRRALERRALENQIRHLQSKLVAENSFGAIIGKCAAMRRVYELIVSVAPQDVTVLIRGESGAGKEVVAREIHERSSRRDRPFVSLNCAAIPESLLESELFGHERGAFTGAVAAKPGRFEMASGGTIFLDEIGDMPLLLQSKLLRVLQERRFERVGGTRTIDVDIRILAATNKDLEQAVTERLFREDLFFRLNVIPLYLPPLRGRVEDIPLLTRHFVERYKAEYGKRLAGIDEEVLKAMVSYHWPGNVRELENVLQRAVILASGDVLRLCDLPDGVRAALAAAGATVLSPASMETPAILPALDEAYLTDFSRPLADKVAAITDTIEKRAIELALQKTGGKREETAELLGLSRKSLYNKITRLGIQDF